MPSRAYRWFRPALLLLGSLTLTACSSVFFGGINAASSRDGIVEHRDQVFDAAHDLALDVYQPRGAVDAPVVVFFYGGTWKRGTRANYRWVGRALARQGVVAMVADYRKYPQVGPQGFMSDAAAATGWGYRHAHAYGGDPTRLAVMGHSAGAHMAALLGTDARWLQTQGLQPRQLCGVVGLAGPYDFLPTSDPELVEIFGKAPQTQQQSQPVHFVGGDEPSMLLLHGDADHVVELQNSTSLQQALQRTGGTAELKIYPGMGHLGLVLALRKSPERSPVLRDTLQFLRQCRAP
ncbi:alpha/beta hydrolase [Xanthomonas arboricola pv. juglandis]|uniref:alpha/beta hydrolase n=1 Tax=Xanthomonas TaxID=338 RepID=UPI000E5A239D|nr:MULTISPECIES: alpha/beta hydrolase [Xanthomonas]CAD1792496.1 alpha/beta hydrolase [Xanthomonas sp. CPBF 426]CAG2090886.1 alpha/beta hydrolase [Xanthomonas euroxanthea]SYZ52743.1 alpha/beta hydrolase [Xanthomonas arboricola pv. juglandis]